MRVLAIGDVVGKNGVGFLQQVLPAFKRTYGVNVCIVNGENSMDGNGIAPASCEDLFTYGADIITTGNHAFRRREMYDYFDISDCVIRPANYPSGTPGKGWCVLDKGSVQIGVINLMGTTYMDALANPFLTVDSLLELDELRQCRIVLVDFHAEATSEKRAMGLYLDGKVSAVFGTHTHVQTADEQILPNGTGYITDLGMTGTIQSVLGVKPEIIIQKFRSNMPARFDFASGPSRLDGCLFDIEDKSGRTERVERIRLL